MRTLSLFLFLLLPLLARGALPVGHPLANPSLNVIERPTGNWPEGALYLHEVVGYILGSPDERTTAQSILGQRGYGRAGRHYLYCAGPSAPAVVDGIPFKTRDEALAYLLIQRIEAAIYLCPTTTFPDTVPLELANKGTVLRVLDSRK